MAKQTKFGRTTDYAVSNGDDHVGTYPNQQDADDIARSVPHEMGGVTPVHGAWQNMTGGRPTDGYNPAPSRVTSPGQFKES